MRRAAPLLRASARQIAEKSAWGKLT